MGTARWHGSGPGPASPSPSSLASGSASASRGRPAASAQHAAWRPRHMAGARGPRCAPPPPCSSAMLARPRDRSSRGQARLIDRRADSSVCSQQALLPRLDSLIARPSAVFAIRPRRRRRVLLRDRQLHGRHPTGPPRRLGEPKRRRRVRPPRLLLRHPRPRKHPTRCGAFFFFFFERERAVRSTPLARPLTRFRCSASVEFAPPSRSLAAARCGARLLVSSRALHY